MKNTKLYVLQNNGIVKLGITAHEDVDTRIEQINKGLSDDKKFKHIVDFEVNQNPAMIERLIHDYLGINQLNIQYLKNKKIILVNADYLDSSQTGYTEFFLADKDKIKQAITAFGILDYINISKEKTDKLDEIIEHSFDFFAENHPLQLKECQPTKKSLATSNNYIQITLAESLNNLSNKTKCDFLIENNKYYLILGNNKISIEEITEPKNEKYLELLLFNKDKLEVQKKDGITLYSIIREFRENNKEISLQPLTSMQKELKEEEFYKFMNKQNGYNKIYNLISIWELYTYDLLEPDNIKKHQIPNFNSPYMFPQYYKLLKEQNSNMSNHTYNENKFAINMVSSIFKIIYNSKDKERELRKLDTFLDYLDDYCQHANDESLPYSYGKPLWHLEEVISMFIVNNSKYLPLAETMLDLFNINDKKTRLSKFKSHF